jgi:hypothetical protein
MKSMVSIVVDNLNLAVVGWLEQRHIVVVVAVEPEVVGSIQTSVEDSVTSTAVVLEMLAMDSVIIVAAADLLSVATVVVFYL